MSLESCNGRAARLFTAATPRQGDGGGQGLTALPDAIIPRQVDGLPCTTARDAPSPLPQPRIPAPPKGLVFDIARNSYVDGPGVRTTVFMKGCNLACRWCHNPEGQTLKPELLVFRDKCDGCGLCRRVCPHPDACTLCGECAMVCPRAARKVAGRVWEPEELLRILLRDRPYYEATGGGVTFSGGECMLQTDFLCKMLRSLKENGVDTAIDTAGSVPWASFESVLPFADHFLYDVKCIPSDLHRAWTGVGNELILDNLKRLFAVAPEKVIIRVPVIPGFNATDEEMRRIADFLRPYGIVPELLPYHAMGVGKAAALGREPFETAVPAPQEMEAFRTLFGDTAGGRTG